MLTKANSKIIRADQFLLSVGGLDPCAYSGILRDLAVWQDYQIPARAVATAITAQSQTQFLDWKAASPDLFQKQLESVQGKIFGVKIGMLATLRHARILAQWLAKQQPAWVLWDPVLQSSSGAILLRSRSWNSTLQQLLEQTHIFTPNIPEAEWILQRSIQTISEAQEAAGQIFSLQMPRSQDLAKTKIILLKGGHLLAAKMKGEVVDILFDLANATPQKLRAPAKSGDPRGTGCTLGAAILAEIAQGKGSNAAIRRAKSYLLKKLF